MRGRQSLLSLICILGLLAMVGGLAPASAQPDPGGVPAIDLAAVPLLPGDLDEPGYQLDTAGYILDEPRLSGILAEQRGLNENEVRGALDASDWERSYGHRLQLLEDRGTATSDPLASVTTWLHEFSSGQDAGTAYASWIGIEPAGSEPLEARRDRDESVLRQISGNEDTIRTLILAGPVIVELVSGDAQRRPDRGMHDAYVDATVDRLRNARSDEAPDVGSKALLLRGEEIIPPFVLTGREGSYQAYRVQDGVVMPSLGELEPSTAGEIAPGVDDLYVSQQVFPAGRNGLGVMNLWLGRFGEFDQARAFARQPMAAMLIEDETIPVGDDGVVYRISGSSRHGERYSGYQLLARFGSVVQIVTWYVEGDAIAELEVARQFLSLQGVCIEREPARGCPPVVPGSLLAVDTNAPAPPFDTDDSGTYRSAEFGWSVPYEKAGWALGETLVEEGYDYIELRSGPSMMTLESVIDHHGDPRQCVLDNLETLETLEEHAEITLGSDVVDEAPGGSDADHAWAIYSVEPLVNERADQEYTIRIDCLTLVAGDVSLVVTHRAPRTAWNEEAERGQALRDAITLEAGRSSDNGMAQLEPDAVYGGLLNMYMPRIWIPLAA